MAPRIDQGRVTDAKPEQKAGGARCVYLVVPGTIEPIGAKNRLTGLRQRLILAMPRIANWAFGR